MIIHSKQLAIVVICMYTPRYIILYITMPQPVTLKKLKLNGSMKTYKTF